MKKLALLLLLSAVRPAAAIDRTFATEASAIVGTTISPSTISVLQNGVQSNVYPNAPLTMSGNINGYLQSVMQNQSNGTNASGDIIITADTGGDTSNYINIGINSSNYNQAGFSITPATWAYLYTSDHGLAVGAGANGTDSNAAIKFFVGPPVSSATFMSITTTTIQIGLGTNVSSFTSNGSLTMPSAATLTVSSINATNAVITKSTMTYLFLLNDMHQSSQTVANVNSITGQTGNVPVFCMAGTTVTISNVNNAKLTFDFMGSMINSVTNDGCNITVNLDNSLAIDYFSAAKPMVQMLDAVATDNAQIELHYTTFGNFSGSHTACIAFDAQTGGNCTMTCATSPCVFSMAEFR